MILPMSDDFGTVNVRRGERGRGDVELLRQYYRQHRDALAKMIADIDRALLELDQIAVGAMPSPSETPLSRPALQEPPELPAQYGDEPRARIPLMLIAAILALAVIGGLIWWASRDRQDGASPIVEETTTAPVSTASDTAVEEVAPAAPAALVAAPRAHDYGVIRKGTRATRQFELTNNSEEPMSIVVSRSACRCLFYEHAPVIPPKAKENLTVTVDGARAKAGDLRETLKVSSKSDATVATTLDVTATIR